MKTVLEWLKYAKLNGYEWADAAIENNDNPEVYTSSLSKALESAFVWTDSPEKREYWFEVVQDLIEEGL